MGIFGFSFKKKTESLDAATKVGRRKVAIYNPPPEPQLVQLPVTDDMKPSEVRRVESINRALSAGRKRYINSISEGGFAAFPAVELKKVMIGVDSGIDWMKRWVDAGGRIYDGRMIARVDSPIWSKISDFNVPYEPFDRTGEYGLFAIKRSECVAMGIDLPITRAQCAMKGLKTPYLIV